MFLAAVPCLYFGMLGYSYLLGENLSFDNSEIQTIYLFRFNDNREVKIDDPYNKIVRSWGGSSISKKIVDGKREVIFDEPAILKSTTDSIEPQLNYVKYKGYMGLQTNQTNFKINSDGVVEIEWKKNKTNA